MSSSSGVAVLEGEFTYLCPFSGVQLMYLLRGVATFSFSPTSRARLVGVVEVLFFAEG